MSSNLTRLGPETAHLRAPVGFEPVHFQFLGQGMELLHGQSTNPCANLI